MKILGLDQSYTSSGIVIINESGQILDFTIVSSDPNQDEFIRTQSIAQKIVEFADKHEVTHAMAEGLAFGSRGDATRKLAGLQFTIAAYLAVISKQRLIMQLVSPTTLKKFATGSGKADKKSMIEHLPDDIRTQFIDAGYKKTKGLPDLTDAYFIAQYALINLQQNNPT